MIRAIAIVVVLAASSLAMADDIELQTDPAKAKFAAGSEAYNAGDYARAADEFRTGFDLEPWPGFLFAWAQAERRGDRCSKALELYRRFVDTQPPEDARELAEEGIAECGKKAPIAVMTPTPPEPPDPGKGTDTDTVPRETGFPHKLAVTLGGVAVVGGGLGVTFWMLARSDAEAAEAATTYPDTEALHDRARRRTTYARIAGGVGIACGVAAVVRLLMHRPSNDDGVDVAITPDGSVVVAGSF